jgi:hypothetical protein
MVQDFGSPSSNFNSSNGSGFGSPSSAPTSQFSSQSTPTTPLVNSKGQKVVPQQNDPIL